MEFKRSLPKSELEIMNALWDLGQPSSAAEINRYMDKGWRVQTLITHLSRMTAKQIVICDHIEALRGARYFYRPLIDRDVYRREEAEKMLENLHKGDVKSLFKTFAETGKITREDVEYLLTLVK